MTADDTLRAESPFPEAWTLPVAPASRVPSSFVQLPNLVALDLDVDPWGGLWLIGSDKEGPGGFGLWYLAAGTAVARCLQGDAVRVRCAPDGTVYVLTADGHVYHRTGGGGIEARPPVDLGALAAQASDAMAIARAAVREAASAKDAAVAAQRAAQLAETALEQIHVPTSGTIDGPITVRLS